MQEVLKQLQSKLEQEAGTLASSGRSDVLHQLKGPYQLWDIWQCSLKVPALLLHTEGSLTVLESAGRSQAPPRPIDAHAERN